MSGNLPEPAKECAECAPEGKSLKDETAMLWLHTKRLHAEVARLTEQRDRLKAEVEHLNQVLDDVGPLLDGVARDVRRRRSLLPRTPAAPAKKEAP